MNKLIKGFACLFFAYVLNFSLNAQVAEICNNGIDDDGDLLIDCYDPDCTGDSACSSAWVNVTSPSNPPPTNFTLSVQEKWRTDTTFYDVFSTQTPAIGDIDNDGVVEVIAYDHNKVETDVGSAGPGDTLFIFNGNNGTIKGYCSLASTGGNATRINNANIVIGNLDSDPFSEIVVMLEDKRVVRFEHTGGAPTWVSAPLSGIVGADIHPVLGIADFNEDGMAEIYQGPHIWNGQTGAFIGSGGYGPGIANGTPVNNVALLVGFGMSVAVDALPTAFCADCDGLEIVCGFQVFSVDIATGTVTPRVTAAPPAALNAPLDGFTAVADYDHDGDLDGIISANRDFGGGDPDQVMIYSWDLQTPTVLSSGPIFLSSYLGSIGQPTIANFDGDFRLEIAFATQTSIVVLDDYLANSALIWRHTTNDGSGYPGASAFDFDGDDQAELIFRDEDSLFIFDGASGDVLFKKTCRGVTIIEKPLVADIDGDRQAEVICACTENPDYTIPPANIHTFALPRFHGYIVAFESAGDPWAPARDIWNQSSYHITNINDDLSVPLQQQMHHLPADGNLNGFNLQSSAYDSLGNPVFLIYTVSIPIAQTDSLSVPTCNAGPFPLPVLNNDIGDSLSLQVLFPPSNGSSSVVNNSILYTPNASYSGPDSLLYVICNSAGCDSAWAFMNVFFQDLVPPVALCGTDTIYLDSNGVAVLDPLELDAGSSDDCGIDSIWAGQTTFTMADLGSNSVPLVVQDLGGNSDSCTGTVVVLEMTGLGVEDDLENGLDIFPVPTNGVLFIRSLRPNIQVDAVTVFDLRGQRVSSIKASNKTLVQIDLAGVSDGIYWLRIDARTGSHWQKIMVQKE